MVRFGWCCRTCAVNQGVILLDTSISAEEFKFVIH
jgi:hypothetical protein